MNKIGNHQPSFQQLADAHAKMGSNDHLDSKPDGLYSKPNSMLARHNAESSNEKRRIGKTKEDITHALQSRVGDRAANRILKENKIRQFDPGSGKKSNRINGDAVTNLKLGDVLKESRLESIRQDITKLDPAVRNQVHKSTGDGGMSLGEVQQHPQLGPMFDTFAKADHSFENIVLQTEITNLDKLLAQHDAEIANNEDASQTLGEIRDQIGKLRDMCSSGDFNLNHAATTLAKKALTKNLSEMGFAQLKELAFGATGFAERARSNVKTGLRDVLHRFRMVFDSSQSALGKLKKQFSDMADGTHLRGAGSKNYIKSGHNKAHFWGGKRADKFAEAKTNIRRQVEDALKGDKARADQIMKPFLNSKNALTKTNLGDIIKLVETELQADAEAKALHESKMMPAFGQKLDQPPTVVSQNPQKDFEVLKEFMGSYTGQQFGGLDSELRDAFETLMMTSISSSSNPEDDNFYPPQDFKADLEDVLGKLAKHGYTLEQLHELDGQQSVVDTHEQVRNDQAIARHEMKEELRADSARMESQRIQVGNDAAIARALQFGDEDVDVSEEIQEMEQEMDVAPQSDPLNKSSFRRGVEVGDAAAKVQTSGGPDINELNLDE